MKKKSNVKPRAVGKGKVVPEPFRVDAPIPPGMKLYHFRADGTACFIVDPTTPGPKSPPKTHPSQARAKKKKGVELTETISKKQKRRGNKKMYDSVQTSSKKTSGQDTV